MKYSLIFTFLTTCASLASSSPLAAGRSSSSIKERRTPILQERAASFNDTEYSPSHRRQAKREGDSANQFPLIRERASSGFTPSVISATTTAVVTVKAAATKTVYVTAYATAPAQTVTVTRTVTAIKTATQVVTVNPNNSQSTPTSSSSSKSAQVASSTTKRTSSTPSPSSVASSKPTSTKSATTTTSKAASAAAQVISISATNIPSPMPTKSNYQFQGQATWYEVGLGACGNWNDDSQYVLAVSQYLYDNYPGATLDNPNNNPICGKKIKVAYGSKSIIATVVDRCEGCPIWNLDLSPTAFEQLNTLDNGMMGIKWHWV